MATERRLHYRSQLNMLVQFRVGDLKEFMREYAANISGGGMFVRTREPHPEGSMIYLQFRLKDGSTIIEGLGKVVHVNSPEHAIPGMGVEFVNLDADSKKIIDSIVEQRAQELGDEV